MRIIEIREKPVSLSDPMSNAAINFQEMTASAVAIVVDAGHKGTFTGYGFSSVGRYAQSGLIAERFAPRLKALEEVEGADGGLDPVRGWAAMMVNEKPGGDGDRALHRMHRCGDQLQGVQAAGQAVRALLRDLPRLPGVEG